MKVIVEYDLSVEDNSDFEIFKMSQGLYSFAFELLYSKLRNMVKYGVKQDGKEGGMTDEQIEIIEYLREWCFEYLNDEGVKLELVK